MKLTSLDEPEDSSSNRSTIKGIAVTLAHPRKCELCGEDDGCTGDFRIAFETNGAVRTRFFCEDHLLRLLTDRPELLPSFLRAVKSGFARLHSLYIASNKSENEYTGPQT